MRSIFTKILLWILATTIISLVGFAVTTRLIAESQPGRVDLIAKILVLQLESARAAHNQGGSNAPSTYLRRLDELFEAEHHLVDESGTDMVDGTDRSAALRVASSPPNPPRMNGNQLVLASANLTGPRLLVLIHPLSGLFGFLPYYLWIFLVVIGLGYALAVHFGRPLLKLRRVVERFGIGDFSAELVRLVRMKLETSRAFDLMAERTETLMTAQRRLLQDVSHELRSPLARLQLTVRLARRSEDHEASLDRIKKEVDRLSTLVDELLQVVAAEEDPAAREHQLVSLDTLLQAVVDDGNLEASANGCKIELDVSNSAYVKGDPELLRRALENVLRNAIRHAPSESTIDLGLAADEARATITIRDRGIGVPEASLTTIFQPFARIGDDRSRSGGGVGLGLSITQRAIALHGGEILARNAHPGLCVTIELPVTTPDEVVI